ncbi:MAG: hypothetical protein JWR73_1542 [Tardiphaga sp.]|nr:hypothetical protein [Tardiphaga sp.]
MERWIPRLLLVLGVVATALALLLTGDAFAANGAYMVDAADISDLNTCKLESWLSAAKNGDLLAVANPSCVIEIGKPVELSLLTSRSRSDGAWSTFVQPKLKFNIEPTGIGKWGYSFLAGSAFDTQTGEQLNAFAEIPATFRFSEVTRVNLNAGWFWDRVNDRHYFQYGAGFDWKFSELWSFTIEAFGLAGAAVADQPSQIRPRIQTGFRYRPNETFSVDVIYGHNITGEGSNWFTVGTTVRFPPPGK